MDTSKKTKSRYSLAEAKKIGTEAGINWSKVKFSPNEFHAGLHEEFEHGSRDKETDVTNNDPIKTAKIAWAHLKEDPKYYKKLATIEKAIRLTFKSKFNAEPSDEAVRLLAPKLVKGFKTLFSENLPQHAALVGTLSAADQKYKLPSVSTSSAKDITPLQAETLRTRKMEARRSRLSEARKRSIPESIKPMDISPVKHDDAERIIGSLGTHKSTAKLLQNIHSHIADAHTSGHVITGMSFNTINPKFRIEETPQNVIHKYSYDPKHMEPTNLQHVTGKKASKPQTHLENMVNSINKTREVWGTMDASKHNLLKVSSFDPLSKKHTHKEFPVEDLIHGEHLATGVEKLVGAKIQGHEKLRELHQGPKEHMIHSAGPKQPTELNLLAEDEAMHALGTKLKQKYTGSYQTPSDKGKLTDLSSATIAGEHKLFDEEGNQIKELDL